MPDLNLTKDQLSQMIPGNLHIDYWYDAICQALPDYDITSPQRIAAFIAQCAHESGGFRFLKENLNYQAASLMRVWPRYFPTMDIAAEYAHNEEKIANRAYANRMGNGNEESGDGARYCGRGLIQITGKDNYQQFADSIQTPVEQIPDYMSTFEGAVQSACWFWESHNLNDLADAGDILTMTKRINGGTLGLEERTKNYQKFLSILGA